MCNEKKSIRREEHDFGPGLEWQGENVTTVTSLFSLKGLILWSLSTRMLAEEHSWALRLQIWGQCWHKSSNQHTDSVNTTRPQWKKKHDGPLWQKMIWFKKNRFYYDYQELHSGLYLNKCWSGNIFKPKNLLNKCVSTQRCLSRLTVFPCHCAIPGGWCPATCPGLSRHTDQTQGAALKAHWLSVAGGGGGPLEYLNRPYSSLCTFSHLYCSLKPSYLCSPTQ